MSCKSSWDCEEISSETVLTIKAHGKSCCEMSLIKLLNPIFCLDY